MSSATLAESRVLPTGVARTFGPDEIIVSKTDLRGRLTYANDVFLRVAGYDEAEVIGRPHNLIRHPDMPRCVFKLLWQTISAGDEIFAYVLNLARDGAHYWVLAHVTPSYDARGQVVGYHSNRRSPSASAVHHVSALYARLCKEERAFDSPVTAMDASGRLLGRILDDAGLTYDEWVWSLTS